MCYVFYHNNDIYYKVWKFWTENGFTCSCIFFIANSTEQLDIYKQKVNLYINLILFKILTKNKVDHKPNEKKAIKFIEDKIDKSLEDWGFSHNFSFETTKACMIHVWLSLIMSLAWLKSHAEDWWNVFQVMFEWAVEAWPWALYRVPPSLLCGTVSLLFFQLLWTRHLYSSATFHQCFFLGASQP